MIGIYLYALQYCNFCINEGCIHTTNKDDSLENVTGFIPSDMNETCIARNPVLLDILVQ